MSRTLYVLNGPNLDYLGDREPEIYGRATLADVETMCREAAAVHGCELVFRQTHREYEMIGLAARGEAIRGRRRHQPGGLLLPLGRHIGTR